MIHHNLEVAGIGLGGIWLGFAIAQMLGFNPTIHRILDIKQGARMGPAAHTAVGNPQCIADGMGQATVGAGSDIEQVKATLEQEGVEGFSGLAALMTTEGIGAKKAAAGLAIGLKHTPGEQGAHVQLGDPGRFQDLDR